MNALVQVSELHRQHADYMSRRQKLWGGLPAKIEPIALPAPVAVEQVKRSPRVKARATVVDVIAEQDERILRLQTDLAEAQARIQSLVETIRLLDTIELGAGVNKRSVAVIVSEVLIDFPGVTWAQVKGARMRADLVRPRHLCMYAVYIERPDLSLPVIGKIFGGRDHSGIHYAVHKIRAEKEREAT